VITWTKVGNRWSGPIGFTTPPHLDGSYDWLVGAPVGASPVRLDPLRAGDLDVRVIRWNLPANDRVVSVDAVEITRRDESDLGIDDLSSSDANVLSRDVRIWFTSGLDLVDRGAVDYRVQITVSTRQGRQVVRDFDIAVIAPLGLIP
jgi:hypothetical protein